MNHYDDDDLLAFLIDENVKKEPTNIVDEEFIDLVYHSMDEVFATQKVPKP